MPTHTSDGASKKASTSRNESDLIRRQIFLAFKITNYASVFGLTGVRESGAGVELDDIERAMNAFANAGVGRRMLVLQSGRFIPGEQVAELENAVTAIEESPLPTYEWPSMSALLGDDLLARLLSISLSSVHRYESGERPTPDPVAARLHFVALVAADLAGSYNDIGIRGWFDRKRSQLGDRTPGEMLSGDWSPDSADACGVRALSSALLAPLAT